MSNIPWIAASVLVLVGIALLGAALAFGAYKVGSEYREVEGGEDG